MAVGLVKLPGLAEERASRHVGTQHAGRKAQHLMYGTERAGIVCSADIANSSLFICL